MGLLLGTRRTLLGARLPYYRKVLSYDPIAYWPLNEPSGSVANCLVDSAQDGTYVGVTLGQTGIGDGNTAPLFDGANDYVDIFSAVFNAAFNGGEGTIALWAKVFDAGVWTEPADWREMIRITDTLNNRIFMGKSPPSTAHWFYVAGGATQSKYVAAMTTTAWMHMAITWSAAADEVCMYLIGVQQGTAMSGLGAWGGALSSNWCTIGSLGKAPSEPWYGWLAHVAVWDTPLRALTIADLAAV